MTNDAKRRAFLTVLENAEADYLRATGWTLCQGGVLWSDPLANDHTHIARVASNMQRQRDCAADNAAKRDKAGAS